MTRSVTILAALVVFIALPFRAETAIVDAQVDGNEFSATIDLPGEISAELTVRFEQVIGLSVTSLGVSAQLVDPLSPSLLGRLPDVTQYAVPAGFPVLIQIEPPVDGGLTFEGVAEIELYTRNLLYTVDSPLRLYSASEGGVFQDITDRVSGGSYRPRGSSGHWSDFLILVDTQPLSATIDDKFDRLEQHLLDHSAEIDTAVYGQLDQLFNDARASWLAGDPGTAIDQISAFANLVRDAANDGDMPRIWRSSRDLDNVDGILRSAARTLRFSLTLAANLL